MRERKTRSVVATSCVTGVLMLASGLSNTQATEPCDDFGECKVLIEINASDGDIGFHWLGDADDLRSMRIDDPNGAKVYTNKASGPLRQQKMTETFGESAEPLCWPDPEADEDEEIVTLREFRELWDPGTYTFSGKGEQGEMLSGETTLSYDLPAAPQMVEFSGGVISWIAGNDLGKCAPLAPDSVESVGELLADGVLTTDPALVPVAAFEVVLEPDVEDGDPLGNLKYTIRVPGYTFAVEVPMLYLMSLPADTPAKIEVGAIGVDDNATFTEEDGFCLNEDAGCDD